MSQTHPADERFRHRRRFAVQNYKKILRWARFYAKEHNCRTAVKQMSRFDKVKHHRGAVTPLDGVEF